MVFNKGCRVYEKQIELLQKEGVEIVQGKIIPTKTDDDVSPDELLRGNEKNSPPYALERSVEAQ